MVMVYVGKTHPGPGRKDKICTFYARNMVTDARVEGNNEEAVRLEKLFKFNRTLFLRTIRSKTCTKRFD